VVHVSHLRDAMSETPLASLDPGWEPTAKPATRRSSARNERLKAISSGSTAPKKATPPAACR